MNEPTWLASPAPQSRWRRALTHRPGPRPPLNAYSVIGEALLAAGILVCLYLTWQLFWTNVTSDREQAAAVAAQPWATPAVSGTLPQTTSAVPDALTPDDFTASQTIAVVRIPRFGADYVRPISEGVDKHTILDKLGIGHFPKSAAPGAVGNFATIGHRTTYGKPYNQIADLQVGDAIIVDTPEGHFTYRVYEHLVVAPTQVDVINPQDGHERVMTLIACTPKGSAAQRYVVHADLVSWSPHPPATSTSSNPVTRPFPTDGSTVVAPTPTIGAS